MGPSRTKLYEKDAEMEATGRLCKHRWVLNGVPNHLGNGLGITLGSAGYVFQEILRKSVVLPFRCHSRAEWLLMRIRVSRLEPCGHKSHARTAQNGFEGLGRSKVWTVSARCSVGVMEIAANRRKAARNQVTSEVKDYLSDKTYD